MEADEYPVGVTHDPQRGMLVLVYKKGISPYYVDLQRLETEADVLSWVLQLQEKSWCTPQMLCDFLSVLQNTVLLRFGTDLRAVKGGRLNWGEGVIVRAV